MSNKSLERMVAALERRATAWEDLLQVLGAVRNLFPFWKGKGYATLIAKEYALDEVQLIAAEATSGHGVRPERANGSLLFLDGLETLRIEQGPAPKKQTALPGGNYRVYTAHAPPSVSRRLARGDLRKVMMEWFEKAGADPQIYSRQRLAQE